MIGRIDKQGNATLAAFTITTERPRQGSSNVKHVKFTKSKRERSFKGVLDRQKHIAYEIGDTTTRSTTMGAAVMDVGARRAAI